MKYMYLQKKGVLVWLYKLLDNILAALCFTTTTTFSLCVSVCAYTGMCGSSCLIHMNQHKLNILFVLELPPNMSQKITWLQVHSEICLWCGCARLVNVWTYVLFIKGRYISLHILLAQRTVVFHSYSINKAKHWIKCSGCYNKTGLFMITGVDVLVLKQEHTRVIEHITSCMVHTVN